MISRRREVAFRVLAGLIAAGSLWASFQQPPQAPAGWHWIHLWTMTAIFGTFFVFGYDAAERLLRLFHGYSGERKGSPEDQGAERD